MKATTFFVRFILVCLVLLVLAIFLSKTGLLDKSVTPTETPVVLQNIPDSAPERVTLVRVIDGDTIRVNRAGEEVTVRLIGINTPETVDPNTPDECYGSEASAYLSALLTPKELAMGGDVSQQDMDRYGRLLRYIYIADGTFINFKMIREGFAVEYTYDRPYEFQQSFRQAQEEAQYAGLGLWSSCPETPNPELPNAQ